MAISHTFSGGTLSVFRDGQLQLVQPFRPTQTHENDPWQDETEALEWLVHETTITGRFSREELIEYKNSLGA